MWIALGDFFSISVSDAREVAVTFIPGELLNLVSIKRGLQPLRPG